MSMLASPLLRRPFSHAMFVVCCLFALAIVGVLAVVTGYLVVKGFSGLSVDLFTKLPTGDPAHPGGMMHAMVGTLVLLGLASVVGVPVGMLAGVYLSEYSGETWLAWPARFIADVLTGVPSIVVGVVGYELLVVPLGGYNGWAGAAALAFIMVPIVARTTEEMLRLVPASYRAGSLALGATKAQTIARVVIPSATGSLVTGVMLALARVAGETAPLLWTALGSRFLTINPSQPFPSLTQQIYELSSSPAPAMQRMAWAGILVLIGMLFVLNLAIRAITARSISNVK